MSFENQIFKDLIDTAILFVDGDRNRDTPPNEDDLFIQIGHYFALLTGNRDRHFLGKNQETGQFFSQIPIPVRNYVC
jgi:hypothetical protein